LKYKKKNRDRGQGNKGWNKEQIEGEQKRQQPKVLTLFQRYFDSRSMCTACTHLYM